MEAGARRGVPPPGSGLRQSCEINVQAARERNAQAAEEARLGHLTARQRLGLSIAKVSQADTDEIVRQLVARAKGGEDKAIHAYARLLTEAFGRSGREKRRNP